MQKERPDPEEVRAALREHTSFTEKEIDEAMEGLTDEQGRLPPKIGNPVQLMEELLTPQEEEVDAPEEGAD